MAQKIKLIGFDVNGTIFDDNQPFIKAINGIFIKFDKPELPVDILRQKFGQPWTTIYRGAGITEQIASENKLYEIYNQIYVDEIARHPIKPFDGLRETLEWLTRKGVKLVIVSSQYNEITIPLLEKYNLKDFFQRIMGLDYPKVDAMKWLTEEFKISSREMGYCGDQEGDILAAKAGGCVSFAFARGLHFRERLVRAKPDFMIDDYADFRKLDIF
ncbi:MAG: HAD family hydrolase [Candidatus Parcubacteria bacterium]|nr:HAD family hydrolase [Candidatus Parcubacteria bacterium]